MKKLLIIIFSIIFSFCGCVVTKKEVETKNCFNSSKCYVKIVLPKFAAQEIEIKALEFEKRKKNVKFIFKRIEDDINYRFNVLNEILNDNVSAFFVHGEMDAKFFKDLIKPFKNVENLTVKFKETEGFKLAEYFSGVFVNIEKLNSMGVSEKNLSSLDGFLNSCKKAGGKDAVCFGEDISSLVCSLGFKEGTISDEFKEIFKLIDKKDQNLNIKLLKEDKLFYIGSSRFLNSELFGEGESKLKCLPLPVCGNKSILKEEDVFCLNKNITKEEEKNLMEFLNLVKIKSKAKQNLKRSETQNMPLGLKREINFCFKKLKEKNISFDEFKNKVKKKYERGMRLEF